MWGKTGSDSSPVRSLYRFLAGFGKQKRAIFFWNKRLFFDMSLIASEMLKNFLVFPSLSYLGSKKRALMGLKIQSVSGNELGQEDDQSHDDGGDGKQQDRPSCEILRAFDRLVILGRYPVGERLDSRVDRLCRQYHADGKGHGNPFQPADIQADARRRRTSGSDAMDPCVRLSPHEQPDAVEGVSEAPHPPFPGKSLIFHASSVCRCSFAGQMYEIFLGEGIAY